MNYKRNIRKQSLIIAISVLALLGLIGGTSYAFFFRVNTNTQNQVVQAGNLKVTHFITPATTQMDEIGPLADEIALSTQSNKVLASVITVENEGTLPAAYKILIGNEENQAGNTTQLVDHHYVRIAVYQNLDNNQQATIIAPTNLADLPQVLDTNNPIEYVLYTGSLDVDSSANFEIKVWLSQYAPVSVIGQQICLMVDVTSEVADNVVGYS